MPDDATPQKPTLLDPARLREMLQSRDPIEHREGVRIIGLWQRWADRRIPEIEAHMAKASPEVRGVLQKELGEIYAHLNC